MPPERVGFVGLGNMGAPMAGHLAAAGYRVVAADANAATLDRFCSRVQCERASSMRDMASSCRLIITMLPDGKAVQQVLLGPQGIAATLAPGSVVLDMSSSAPVGTRELQRQLAHSNVSLVDAPVSGGTAGAAAATLTFMVGGEASAFSRAQPILEAMGRTIVHTGPAGNGQAVKICNNMLLAVSMIGVCEALTLGQQLGLAPQTLFDVVSKSTGQCWALTGYCPVPGPVPSSPANRDYAAGFTAAMMLKDLRLAQQAAGATAAPTPMGAAAAAFYQLFVDQGAGGLDFSAIYRFIAKPDRKI